MAVVPLTFTNQPPELVRSMVDEAIEDVIAGLMRPMDVSEPINEVVMLDEEILQFEGKDQLDGLDRMNRQFLEYAWSDGFPLVAPTPEKVDWMLAGTKRNRGDVIAILEPGFGIATVEKIAINAVMAGCRPEHLPVLIAAVQCIAEPKIMLRQDAMSTGPHAPLILVNGPIAMQLNINSGRCALGPGAPSYANTVIGRSLRLVMMNCGHTYAGVSDMDTIGSPAKYSMCAAENIDDSPWEPFHVERGFPKDVSTVTVQFEKGFCELHDFQNYKPELLIEVFCSAAKNAAYTEAGGWLLGRRADPRYNVEETEHNMMFICPEHAENFARAGWDKNRVREAMYKGSKMPFRTLMLPKEPRLVLQGHPELQWLFDQPETLVPIVETPECFEIAVVGGQAGRGLYFFGTGDPITKVVED